MREAAQRDQWGFLQVILYLLVMSADPIYWKKHLKLPVLQQREQEICFSLYSALKNCLIICNFGPDRGQAVRVENHSELCLRRPQVMRSLIIGLYLKKMKKHLFKS